MNVSVRPFSLSQHAFRKFLRVYTLKINSKDISAVFQNNNSSLKRLFKNVLKNTRCIKFQLCLHCEFTKVISSQTQKQKAYFCSKTCELSSENLINDSLIKCQSDIDLLCDLYTERGSGWHLHKISLLEVRIGQYIPHRGGCLNVKLNKKISSKKACINIKTKNDCFMYSVLASLHPVTKNAERTTNYLQFIEKYNFENVRGLVELTSIPKFEKNNNISINVYTQDSKSGIIPLRVSAKILKKHANLFLFNEHYFSIRNYNRLLGSHSTWKRHFCYNCLCGFRNSYALEQHTFYCKKPQKIRMPKLDSTLKYNQFYKEIMHPCVIYADFETLAKKIDKKDIYQQHTPSSYGYVCVDWTGKIIISDFYRGLDASKKFLHSLKSTSTIIATYIQQNKKPLIMNLEDNRKFQMATKCWLCENDLNNDKVRDHDHLTGKFRGAAHSLCNLMYAIPKRIPIVFHNLKNFDSHLIIQALEPNLFEKIRIIPHSIEKFIAFTLDQFVFIDSYAFLSSSLDNLSQNLKDNEKNDILLQMFHHDDLSYISNKGILPYDYIDDWSKFDETLPSKDKFYNKLNNCEISDQEYHKIQKFWNHFSCSTLGQFHDIYLKTDVLLLTAVFEQFRKMSNKEFGLDPCHFFSAPGLTWSAMMKITKEEVDLITDVDMLLMIESGIRGGMTSCNLRYCKANNQYLDDFDKTEPSSFITYLDVNNLYGFALSLPLPISNFEWFDPVNIDFILAAEEEDTGYILEVDLEYPHHLHDLHNDFPLAPEKKIIKSESLSPYQRNLEHLLHDAGHSSIKTEKLIGNFFPKKNYVTHIENLKYYLKKGMIIKKIHRILKFKQTNWIAPYIALCTRKRQQALSSFEKDFWKLLVNSLYGKSIEDKRKHVKVDLILSRIQAEKKLRKTTFDQFQILDENKALFKMKNLSVFMNKPIYIGFTVLELSKLWMYRLHYEFFKKVYNSKLTLAYTDTDSYIYYIQTDDLYQDFAQHFNPIMDFSGYPKEHYLYNENHKKCLGYLKDEMDGQQISEFIGLKPKLYVIKAKETYIKRAKGIKKSVLNKNITFSNYHDALFKNKIFHHEMNLLQSKNHEIYATMQNKLSLNPLDDKRYILSNHVSTLAHGHNKINYN